MKGSPLEGALLALLLEFDQPTYPWRMATLLGRRLGLASGTDRDFVYRMLQGARTTAVVGGARRCMA